MTIAEALLALDAPGSFAARLKIPADKLVLSLEKLGRVEFPVSPAAAGHMLSLATRSPFGWGEHTIVDPEVRSSWEVPRSRLRIDGRRWNPVLRERLVELREELGLPKDGCLTASLDKLTIYGPGEFFAAHQDTEKDDDMIGTLIVVLPSRFTGGTMRVRRHGEVSEFRRTARSAEQIEAFAFYADCQHEVRPIKTGHRVALVYRLGFKRDAQAGELAVADVPADHINALERAVADHFSSPVPRPHSFSGETSVPEKLVVLLDHQYTPRNLGWSKLKHADNLRAAALRAVASKLDLDLHVALADIHESWQCQPSMSSYRSRWGRWRDDDDDDEDENDGDYELDSLIDSKVELRHWLSSSGGRVEYDDLPVGESELVFTTANDKHEPFESEYEGYMGNWGDTLERWYHRAAFVLWPRARAFIVEARLDPRGAIVQLIEGPAPERIEALLEVWPECVGREPSAGLVIETLRLAAVISDAEQAERLLSPFSPGVMDSVSVEPLMRAAQRHGAPWGERVVDSWHQGPFGRRRAGRSWQACHPPRWLSALVDEDAKLGLELARFIAQRKWSALQAESMEAARLRSPYVAPRIEGRIEGMTDVLRSAQIAGAKALHRSIVGHALGADSWLSPVELAVVSIAICEQIDPSERRLWGLKKLVDHARRQLEAELAKPIRGADDWAMTLPRGCKCADCRTLYEFLESHDVQRIWPLAKARRKHIHYEIDGGGLPVSHTTRRTGSPHKLVVTKTRALRAVEAEVRAEYQRALDMLNAGAATTLR